MTINTLKEIREHKFHHCSMNDHDCIADEYGFKDLRIKHLDIFIEIVQAYVDTLVDIQSQPSTHDCKHCPNVEINKLELAQCYKKAIAEKDKEIAQLQRNLISALSVKQIIDVELEENKNE